MQIAWRRHPVFHIGLGVLAVGLLASTIPAFAQDMGRRDRSRDRSNRQVFQGQRDRNRDHDRFFPQNQDLRGRRILRHRTRTYPYSTYGYRYPRTYGYVYPRTRSYAHRHHRRHLANRGLHRGFVLGRGNPHRFARSRGAFGFNRRHA